jgi:hypothetical protein
LVSRWSAVVFPPQGGRGGGRCCKRPERAPPTQSGCVVQVLVAWVACWCLRAMPGTNRAGPAPLRARPGNEKTDPGPCLRATPVRISGPAYPIWPRRFQPAGTEPDYEIYNLLAKMSLPLLMKLLPLHEIKVPKCRCAIKRCDIDSARRELSIGERAVRADKPGE